MGSQSGNAPINLSATWPCKDDDWPKSFMWLKNCDLAISLATTSYIMVSDLMVVDLKVFNSWVLNLNLDLRPHG